MAKAGNDANSLEIIFFDLKNIFSVALFRKISTGKVFSIKIQVKY